MLDAGSTIQRPRAGFWRRFAAAIVDVLIVTVPIQLAVVVLFAATNGAIQTTSGLAYTNCTPIKVEQLPQGLVPPPPDKANFAKICSTGFFGLETARQLVVTRVTKTSYGANFYNSTYALNASGHQSDPTSLNWLAYLALATYLVLMERRFGATVGKHLLGLRVVQTREPEQTGLPWRNAVARYVMMAAGYLPAVMFVLVGARLFGGDHLLDGKLFYGFAACASLGTAWLVWHIVEAARKRDPLYDRVAGTAVVRV